MLTVINSTVLRLNCQFSSHHVHRVSEESGKHSSKGTSTHSPNSIIRRRGVIEWKLLRRDTHINIIILDPEEQPMTMRSNDTLVDTPFQLISGFFHVNQGVLCCAGVCWRGGGQQAC